MIGDRIKNRRIELNMTQQELADKTSFKTKGSISRIENNLRDLNPDQIVEFAKVLNTNPSYLLGWHDEQLAINVLLTMIDKLDRNELQRTYKYREDKLKKL